MRVLRQVPNFLAARVRDHLQARAPFVLEHPTVDDRADKGPHKPPRPVLVLLLPHAGQLDVAAVRVLAVPLQRPLELLEPLRLAVPAAAGDRRLGSGLGLRALPLVSNVGEACGFGGGGHVGVGGAAGAEVPPGC